MAGCEQAAAARYEALLAELRAECAAAAAPPDAPPEVPPLLPLLQAHLEHAEAMSEGRRADEELLRGVVAAADEARLCPAAPPLGARPCNVEHRPPRPPRKVLSLLDATQIAAALGVPHVDPDDKRAKQRREVDEAQKKARRGPPPRGRVGDMSRTCP